MKRSMLIVMMLLFTGFAFSQTVVTIYEIQSGAIAEGDIVQVSGIVTTDSAESHYGAAAFLMQDGTGPYTGIIVYGSGINPARGDSVVVVGEVQEYYTETEIGNTTVATIVSSGNPVPAAEVLTLAQLDTSVAEQWEGVLIQVQDVSYTGIISYGEWYVTDGTDTVKVDNSGLYTYVPSAGDVFVSITGPLAYTYSEYKIAPRTDDDFVFNVPMISDVSISPAAPTDGEDVTVTAVITHTGTFTATLRYTITAGDTTDVTMVNITGDTYSGVILGQADGVTVYYLLSATDDVGNTKITEVFNYLVLPSGGVITPIYDIQYTTDPSGDSPLKDQTVTISGVVTAEFWGTKYNDYLYVQDAEGPWNGVLVYEYDGWSNFDFQTPGGTEHSVAEGDSVTITGEVQESYGRTCLNNISDVFIWGKAVNMIAPAVVTPGQIKTGGTDAEAYESCLVTVADVTVAEADIGYGEWTVTDGSDTVGLDDLWKYYYWPEDGQVLTSVTGILDYAYSANKIQPRLARDVAEDGVTRLQRINQVLYSDLLRVTTDDTADESYYTGDTVTVEGVVTVPTGLNYAGSGIKFMYKDIHGGPWSGCLVYSPDTTALGSLPLGRLVRTTGTVFEYDGGAVNCNATEIDLTQPLFVLGNAPVPGDTVNTGDLRHPTTAEQWEGGWITCVDAEVVGYTDDIYQQMLVDDGSGVLKIGSNSLDTLWNSWEPPPVGTGVIAISGYIYHRHGLYSDSTAYKMEPTYITDIVLDIVGTDDNNSQPVAFSLNQNYPNPFNPVTSIDFTIPVTETVKLTVYDLRGRQVRTLVNQTMDPGHYLVKWNGKNDAHAQVSSGVYFYRMKAGDYVKSRKMILVR